MEELHNYDMQSLCRTFRAAERSPEGILLRSILGITALLIAWSLFDHRPWPLIPAAGLVAVLRTYHLRRLRSESESTADAPISARPVAS